MTLLASHFCAYGWELKMNVKSNRWILIGVAILAGVLLTACSGPDEHIWLKSPGWSRAVFLGNTALNDPVPMTLDEDGQVYFVLLSSNEERTKTFFDVIALGASGLPLWQYSLEEITLNQPDSPQIVWEGGNLRLFWMDDEHLYTFPLNANGTPLDEQPTLLSADKAAGSYSLAADDSGAHTLWFTGPRNDPGVYALSAFDGSGELTSVDPDGIRIQLRYDRENTLHATWVQFPVGYGSTRLLYGKYPFETRVTTIEPRVIREFTGGPSNGLDGPTMGIDANDVYIFWTVTVRTGLDAGIQTYYVHFPLVPFLSAAPPQQIAVPSIYGLQYEYLSNSPLDAGERVSLDGSNIPLTTEVQEIVPNQVQADELAIIFRSPTEHLWRKVRNQINVAYFYEGALSSYQPLSFTTTLSTSPNLINSADRHLYATWLEKLETGWHAVYFASTSPGIKETMSHATARELGRVAMQVSFGMLVGMLMAPIAAGVWVIAPLGILFLFTPLRKSGSTRVKDAFGVLSILLAIGAFWVGKTALLPGMLNYVPFSAWVPEIPRVLAAILRWGVPIMFSLIALFVAWFYTYRQSNKSTLYFLLIYVGVDSVLTASVYAVLVYGAI